MRASRLLPLVLITGAIAWALRRSGLVSRLLGRHEGRTDAGSLPRDTVDELATAEPLGSTVGDLAAVDPALLVEAERELLTVPGEPGETHRRRDQTAGAAAREIAAAQVRSRRNGATG